jgi:drug/metabolite transporter (DMT)-like permease
MVAKWFRLTRQKAAPLVGLLLLCLLWSLGSLRGDLFPHSTSDARTPPPLEKQALRFAFLALAATVFATVRHQTWPRSKNLRTPTFVGLGLFVAPALLIYFADDWVSELTRVALFSLAPVFAVVFEPHLGRSNAPQSKAGLMASLIAVLGTMCVFPVDPPGSIEAGLAFCGIVLAAACVAAANCCAVRAVTESARESIVPFTAIASSSAAIGFGAIGALTERSRWTWTIPGAEFTWFALVDLPALLLLFWLLRRMSATRMTTRFLLAPLITNLVGLAILRPSVSLRAGLGLILVAGSAGWLLFAPEENATTNRSLFQLD